MNELKLPVVSIFQEALTLPVKHFQKLLKVGFPLILTITVIILFNYFTRGTWSNIAIDSIDALLTVAFYISLVIAIIGCHRTFLLKAEAAENPQLFNWTGNEIKYIGWWIVIVLRTLVVALVLAIVGVIAYPFANMLVGNLFAYLAIIGIPFYYFASRWSLVLPSSSIGKHGKSTGWSWQLTDGNGWRLTLLMVGTPLVFNILMSFLQHFHSIVYTFIVSAIWLIIGVIQVGVLSLSYAYLISHEDESIPEINSDLGNETEVEIIIKNNKFEPAEISAPAGSKIKLKVVNTDPTPRKFASYKLHCEKIIPGNSTGIIYVKELNTGEYGFFGELSQKPARGKLIVK